MDKRFNLNLWAIEFTGECREGKETEAQIAEGVQF